MQEREREGGGERERENLRCGEDLEIEGPVLSQFDLYLTRSGITIVCVLWRSPGQACLLNLIRFLFTDSKDISAETLLFSKLVGARE